MATFSLIQKGKGEKLPVFIRLNHKKNQRDFAQGISLEKKLVNKKTSQKFLKGIKDNVRYDFLNSTIKDLDETVDILNDMVNKLKRTIDIEDDKEFFDHIIREATEKKYLKGGKIQTEGLALQTVKIIGMFERWQEYIDLCHDGKIDKKFGNTQGSKMSNATIQLRENSLKSFKKYFEATKQPSPQFESFNCDVLMKFSEWNFTTKNSKGEFNGNVYVNALILHFRVFMTWATEKGYNNNTDWQKWKKWIEPSDDENIYAISIEQIIKLTEYKPIPKSDKDQTQLFTDLMIWQIGTCMGIADVQAVRVGDITIKSGKYFLEYRRIKTQTGNIIVELKDIALPIYIKYCQGKDKDDLLFVGSTGNYIREQTYSEHIHKITKDLDFDNTVEHIKWIGKEPIKQTKKLYEVLTTHCFRKSGISLLINLGVPADVVKTISGHKPSSTSFHRYVKRFDPIKFEELERAMSKYRTFVIDSKDFIKKIA